MLACLLYSAAARSRLAVLPERGCFRQYACHLLFEFHTLLCCELCAVAANSKLSAQHVSSLSNAPVHVNLKNARQSTSHDTTTALLFFSVVVINIVAVDACTR